MNSNKRSMVTKLYPSQLSKIEIIVNGKNKKRCNTDYKKNVHTKLFRS